MAKKFRQKNGIAKALRTPRYKMRVVKSKKKYKRKTAKGKTYVE